MVFQAMAIELSIPKLHTQDITPSDSTSKIQIASPLKKPYEAAAPSRKWAAALSAL